MAAHSWDPYAGLREVAEAADQQQRCEVAACVWVEGEHLGSKAGVDWPGVSTGHAVEGECAWLEEAAAGARHGEADGAMAEGQLQSAVRTGVAAVGWAVAAAAPSAC